jgi:hypothetical protein
MHGCERRTHLDENSRPHWNEDIPGIWQGTRSVKAVGSYIGRHVRSRRGVYRLIAMADMRNRQPMVINRIAGRDATSTLYVGCATSLRFRLQQLIRSLREPRRGRNLNEHSVGERIRRNPLLFELFPRECLAVAWAHIEYPEIFEKNLLGHYEHCFGELPPFNIERGHEWFEPSP